MTGHFDRDLQSLFQSLGDDVAGARMPSPSAARKRAAQRTRRQVTGAVLTGVAAVAAGTVIVFGSSLPLADDNRPASTPSATTTEQPTETPTPTPTTDVAIPGNALMTADDIEDTWENSPPWEPAEPADAEIMCGLDLSEIGAQHEQAAFSRVVEGSLAPRAIHDIVQAKPGTASELFAKLRTEIENCAPDREGAYPRLIEKSEGTGLGDEAWLIRYWSEIPGDELAAWKVNIALVREGDAISRTTVYWADSEANEAPDMVTPVNAAVRMCEAMFGASCADDPQFPEIDLEAYEVVGGSETETTTTLAEDPYLTDDDVETLALALQRAIAE